MNVETLEKSIKKLKEKRKEIDVIPLTTSERKKQISDVKNKLSKLEDKLNDITHYKEKNKANNLIDTFGGYCFAWWDSPKNKFRIMITHRGYEPCRIAIEIIEKGELNNTTSVYDLINNDDRKQVKSILFDLMVECINKEK